MPESWDGILLEILQFLLLAESVSLGSMNTFWDAFLQFQPTSCFFKYKMKRSHPIFSTTFPDFCLAHVLSSCCGPLGGEITLIHFCIYSIMLMVDSLIWKLLLTVNQGLVGGLSASAMVHFLIWKLNEKDKYYMSNICWINIVSRLLSGCFLTRYDYTKSIRSFWMSKLLLRV
jgi:type IV secretory pathway VirB2 component (pilin)